jgi:hypothetical protein
MIHKLCMAPYVAFMFFNTHNILYNYIFIWIQSKCSLMLVVSLFEVLNLVIIVCLFYYSIIYLYYQLFIHQNYTRSAHILKRGIFLIWGPYRIQLFGKPNVRFGIGRSDMRHRFYIFCQRPNPAILLSRVLLLNYLFIIWKKQAERLNRTVHRGQPAKKEKWDAWPASPRLSSTDTPTPRHPDCLCVFYK